MPAKKRHVKRKPRKRVHKHKLTNEEERTLFLKEQTILAKERTILSFMRTGLTSITVGFTVVAIGPILSQSFSVNPSVSFIIGAGVAVVGFVELIESIRRLGKYKSRMKEITHKLGDEEV
jgi:uncharacterized membrane protein YidH (DUF202 family)